MTPFPSRYFRVHFLRTRGILLQNHSATIRIRRATLIRNSIISSMTHIQIVPIGPIIVSLVQQFYSFSSGFLIRNHAGYLVFMCLLLSFILKIFAEWYFWRVLVSYWVECSLLEVYLVLLRIIFRLRIVSLAKIPHKVTCLSASNQKTCEVGLGKKKFWGTWLR